MTARTRIAPVLALGLLLASSGLVSFGCARQGEGERCSLKNGDLDCSENLTCTPSSQLRYGSDTVDRCCPDTGGDNLCTPGRSGGTGGSTGEGGAGGEGGDTSGTGGGNGVGATCIYNSDCLEPLVCKGTTCQYECNVTRDCADGYTCEANSCILDP